MQTGWQPSATHSSPVRGPNLHSGNGLAQTVDRRGDGLHRYKWEKVKGILPILPVDKPDRPPRMEKGSRFLKHRTPLPHQGKVASRPMHSMDQRLPSSKPLQFFFGALVLLDWQV